MTLATHEEVVDAEIVRTHTEWAEVIKSDLGRAVEGIVSAGKHLIAAKADVNHGEWLPMLTGIGISDSYARKLMGIGRAFSNRSYRNDLPGNITVLYELSRMDSSDIEEGIETGRITPNMKIEDAKAFANNEWPTVPEAEPEYVEPSTEERVRKFEEAHERLVNEGVIPRRKTEEEREADAKEFVQSLIGNSESGFENENVPIEFGGDESKPIVTPTGHAVGSGEDEYTDAANGIRNDVQARTNMLLDYLGAVGKNLPGDNLPDYANDHVIQALKNNMEDVQNAFEWALSQIERN